MKPTDSPVPPDPGGRGRQHGAAGRFDDGVPHHQRGTHDELHNEDVAHEHSDINVRAVLTSAAILVVIAIVVHVGMWLLFGYFERGATAVELEVSPLTPAPTEMPPTTIMVPEFTVGATGPALLTNEPMALQRYYQEQLARLHGYGWVDESAGVAHIPIERAKELIVERGLPVREGAEEAAFGVLPPVRGEASGGRVITLPLPEASEAPVVPSPEKSRDGH